jgi:hypothetical protein
MPAEKLRTLPASEQNAIQSPHCTYTQAKQTNAVRQRHQQVEHFLVPIVRRCHRLPQATAPRLVADYCMPAGGLCSHPGHNGTQSSRHTYYTQTTIESDSGSDTCKSSTNMVALRSRVAAGVRHEPSCHIKVTESACQQKRRGTFLNGTQSSHCTYYTQAEQMKAAVAMTSANRRRTWSRSDRASRPASVTSQRATSR